MKKNKDVKNEAPKKEKKVKAVKKDKKEKKEKTKKKSGIVYFFKRVIDELKLTVWPKKPYMVKYSIATFATIILCCVYFSLIYLLFSFIKELR